MSVELVVLGNLAVDDLVFADGSTRMGQAGGAALFVALGAALWRVRTGVVSRRGTEYPLEALAARGIRLEGVRELGGPGLRTWLLHEGSRRQAIHRLDGPSHAEASPSPNQIPTDWRSARAFHLAPMPMEVQDRLVKRLEGIEGAWLSLDPYEPLDGPSFERWAALAARVDALFLSEDELGIEDDPLPILQRLARGRLRFVICKRGARGGLLYEARSGRVRDWSARAEKVVDGTGGGDAFAAGFLAGWLRGEAVELALMRGVVTASFALERWGAAGLAKATTRQAEERWSRWAKPGESVSGAS